MRLKDLTKKERKHMRQVAGCRSLAAFARTAAHQAAMRAKDPRPQVEPCWDGRFIARKLGLEV